MKIKVISLLLMVVLVFTACQNSSDDGYDTIVTTTNRANNSSTDMDAEDLNTDGLDSEVGVDETTDSDIIVLEEVERGKLIINSLEDIDGAIAIMTLEEKAGQIIQAERGGIQLSEVAEYNIGSILSGGGSVPSSNTPEGWITMYNRFQKVSRNSSSGIPLVYGIDAVHGNNNVENITVFPHNIGLGAANDPVLMEAIGRATSREVEATGVNWNFAPAVSCVQDIRWGRSYESYSENIDRVADLAVPYIIGLQEEGTLATTKHFIGDGQTSFGTGEGGNLIDRGDVTVGLEALKEINIDAYKAAIEAGTKAIMASYNSIDGTKVHGDKTILTDLLRDELGFEGLVVSDWEAIHTIAPTLKEQVALAVNAGVDLLMQPYNWKEVHQAIIENVNEGIISMERLDEAVKRNLVFKFEAGLFTENFEKVAGEVGTEENKAIAREAVAKSMVLLQNNGALPLAKDTKVYLIGPASDNVGIQSGGWTREWQGNMDPDLNNGTSIKDAFEIVLAENGGMLVEDPSEADVVVVVIGEKPYAEMMGDTADLSLVGPTALEGNVEAVMEASSYNIPVVTVMIAGRPMLVDEYLKDWDAFVMAWLPGTEGQGITDILFGDMSFTGTLPVTWPLTNEQADESVMQADYDPSNYQFEYDFGLSY